MNINCFLFDRDGVLIKNLGYLIDSSKIKFLNKKKIKVIIVTNQSGVARGYFSIKQLKRFNSDFLSRLIKFKARVDKIYFCPFYKKGIIPRYKKDSFDRKPNPGMILKALKKFKIKKKNSFMIGDSRSDYLAAKRAGIKFEYKKNYSLYKQVKNIMKTFKNKNES